MKKLLIQLFLVLAITVPIKLSWERSLDSSYQELKLGGASLSVELRSKLSQNLAVALLSGFRGIVADFVWINGHVAWENQVWYKLKEAIELSVVLQPHSISFWDLGGWHMAWNASYAESTNPKYSSKALRTKMQREWIDAGKKFLEEGIKNNPETYELHFRLGWLIYQKLNDPLGAVEPFEKAASFPEAPSYVGRMIGHMYEKAGQTEKEYEVWKRLWAGDHSKNNQLWDKIAQFGHEAEIKLNIPPEQRIFPSPVKSFRPRHSP